MTSSTTPTNYKLYDLYGNVVYNGNSFNEAFRKAKLLPAMRAIVAFNAEGKDLGAVWAERGSGIPTIKLDSLLPN